MRARRSALVIASAALIIAASSPLQMPADGPTQNSSVRPLLLAEEAPGYVRDAAGRLKASILFDEETALDGARDLVASLNGTVLDENRFDPFRVLDVSIDAGSIDGLLDSDLVAYIDLAPPPRADAGFEQTDEHDAIPLWIAPYDLTAVGFTIGMWEGYIPWGPHTEFIGRVLVGDTGVPAGNHATHIGGILIGRGASPSEPALSRGFAYQALLKAWDFWDVESEFADAVNEGIMVANNSWGGWVGWWWDPIGGMTNPGWRDNHDQGLFGAYITETRNYDMVIHNADQANDTFVVAFPAGDDRDEGIGNDSHDGTWYPDYPHVNPYFDCINPVATGKNTITVGATNSGTQAGEVTPYSCWGPTDDGRIKPDLVARGEDVYSAVVNGSILYGQMSGTSQATAAVSGSAALVIQQFERMNGGYPGTATVKALMLNSTHDRGPAGPDYLYGYGSLNTHNMTDLVVRDGGTGKLIKQRSITDGVVDTFDLLVHENSEPLRLTLAWIDPPGSLSAPDALINDLDLRLVAPGDVVHYPFRMVLGDPTALAVTDGPNTVDTVEQAVIENPTPGLWRVEVAGTDVLGVQKYSLVGSAPLNAGAAEPTGVVFDRNPDGVSVDIRWDPDLDPELSEYRIYRTPAPGAELELIAVLPTTETTYTDTGASANPLLGYEIRCVCVREGVREVSVRTAAHQVPTPVIVSPMHGGAVQTSGETRIMGEAVPLSNVTLYTDRMNPQPLATVIAGYTGIFWLDHDFGGSGTFEVFAQAAAEPDGISLPSMEVVFTQTP